MQVYEVTYILCWRFWQDKIRFLQKWEGLEKVYMRMADGTTLAAAGVGFRAMDPKVQLTVVINSVHCGALVRGSSSERAPNLRTPIPTTHIARRSQSAFVYLCISSRVQMQMQMRNIPRVSTARVASPAQDICTMLPH